MGIGARGEKSLRDFSAAECACRVERSVALLRVCLEGHAMSDEPMKVLRHGDHPLELHEVEQRHAKRVPPIVWF